MLKRNKIIPHPNYVFNKIKHIIVYIYDYKCQICGLQLKNLDVHHYDNNHNNNDVENLIPVCKSCHRLIHKGVIFEKPKMTIFLYWNLDKIRKYKEFLEK